MALPAGGMRGVRNDSRSRKHKYARTSQGTASESLSRGVGMFFAQEFCFIKQEHGPPTGSKQGKTDVRLTTVVGPLRRVPVGVPPPSEAVPDPSPPNIGGGDGGGRDRPIGGPVAKDLDRNDFVARLGATGGDAAIKAGGHVDAARQRAAIAVRSATVAVAAATAACEAARDAEPVGPLRDASTLLARLLAANPLHARGTTSYASAALGDAESASTAVLRAVDTVTVPPHRPPAAVSGGGGAADAAAGAAAGATLPRSWPVGACECAPVTPQAASSPLPRA